jgi:hypothetical protein
MIILLSIVSVLLLFVVVILSLYIRNVLSKLLLNLYNMDELLQSLSNYQLSVQGIHEMEMFYGEPVLETLIQNTKGIIATINKYKKIYELIQNLEEEDVNNIGDESEETQE